MSVATIENDFSLPTIFKEDLENEISRFSDLTSEISSLKNRIDANTETQLPRHWKNNNSLKVALAITLIILAGTLSFATDLQI